jgi:hypothetical protein
MPKTGRVVLPNHPHRVVQRGHNRQVIFANTRVEKGLDLFIEILAER